MYVAEIINKKLKKPIPTTDETDSPDTVVHQTDDGGSGGADDKIKGKQLTSHRRYTSTAALKYVS